MDMQTVNRILILAAMVVGTMLTRFLPFLLFPGEKKMPPFMEYLSRSLPYATMGLLVVYCLKGVEFSRSPFGAPEILSVILVGALHHWRHNILLSIAGGTAVYMLLIQVAVPALIGG